MKSYKENIGILEREVDDNEIGKWDVKFVEIREWIN